MKNLNHITNYSVGHNFRPFVILVLLISAVGCSLTTERQPLEIHTVSPLEEEAVSQTQSVFTGPLKVLSLNMAHGRKDGMNQMFMSRSTIHDNILDIATLLKQTGADLVALQEADGPSRWSGRFDHVATLAQQAQYPWHARAGHARGWLYNYGTALLSRAAFVNVIGHSFEPTPPSMTKGFLLSQITWQPNEQVDTTIHVDVVSVHLDFSRQSVRQEQIKEMMSVLAERNHPMIILGDFNSDWLSEDHMLKGLIQEHNLSVYKPEATDLGTYYRNGRRLDWILISKELEFKSYAVLPGIVSDHAAVFAEINIKTR